MDTSTKRAVFKVIRKLLRYKTVEVYFAEPSSWLAVEPASVKTVGLAAVYARVYDNAYATPEEVRCDIEKIWASCAEGGEPVYQEARKAMPELRDIFRAEWDSAFGSQGNTDLQTDAICQWAQPPQQASRVQGYQAGTAATSSMGSIPACRTAAPPPVPVVSQELVAVHAEPRPTHARLPQASSPSTFGPGNVKGSSSLQQLQLLQLLLARQRANEQAQVQDSSLSSRKPAVGCKRAASDVHKVSDSALHTSVSLDDLEQSLRLMDSPDSLWDHCLAKRPKLPDDEADDRLPAFWLT